MDELDAQIAVLEAEKARRQCQVANAASVWSGSAAAANDRGGRSTPPNPDERARQAGNGAHLRRQPEVTLDLNYQEKSTFCVSIIKKRRVVGFG